MDNKNNPLMKYRPDREPFIASDYPFYWIALVHNRYCQNMEVHLKKVGMTVTSWRVAMLLRQHGALSVTEITKHASFRMPTVTRTIYKMRDQGFVKVYPLETDARITMVEITDEGIKLIEEILPLTSSMFDELYEGLSDGQLQLLNETLAVLNENLPALKI